MASSKLQGDNKATLIPLSFWNGVWGECHPYKKLHLVDDRAEGKCPQVSPCHLLMTEVVNISHIWWHIFCLNIEKTCLFSR
jgi:hypothetical protein